MQKSIASVDYFFHENYMYILQDCYEKFIESDMIMLCNVKCGTIPCSKCVSQSNKLLFDTALTHIIKKSLVLITNGISETNCFEHQYEIVKANRNAYFSCLRYRNNFRMTDINYDKNIVDIFNINCCVPRDISKCVVIHANLSPVNFDFREFICLQNVYHFVLEPRMSMRSVCAVIAPSEPRTLQYHIARFRSYDRFNFRLPYGCTVEVIDDFNKLVN